MGRSQSPLQASHQNRVVQFRRRWLYPHEKLEQISIWSDDLIGAMWLNSFSLLKKTERKKKIFRLRNSECSTGKMQSKGKKTNERLKKNKASPKFLSNIMVLKRIKIHITAQHQNLHKHLFVSDPFWPLSINTCERTREFLALYSMKGCQVKENKMQMVHRHMYATE